MPLAYRGPVFEGKEGKKSLKPSKDFKVKHRNILGHKQQNVKLYMFSDWKEFQEQSNNPQYLIK